MDLFRSLTGDVIAKSLDGHYARQKAIVSNISNAETPNYQRRDVDFQSNLRDAIKMSKAGEAPSTEGSTPNFNEPLSMQGTNPLHFNYQAPDALQQRIGQGAYQGTSSVKESKINDSTNESYRYRNDGNGVDLEREMVAMTKNTSRFQALITFQSRLNQQLKGVLSEQ
jgi:flagellar basal-body rod protein FlgB